MIKGLRCKQSQSEWFEMKCCTSEKLTASELFTMVMIGTRRLKSLIPLKLFSQRVIASYGHECAV